MVSSPARRAAQGFAGKCLESRIPGHTLDQKIEIADDGAEQVVEVVGDPAAELADRIHLLRLTQLRLGGAQRCYIEAHAGRHAGSHTPVDGQNVTAVGQNLFVRSGRQAALTQTLFQPLLLASYRLGDLPMSQPITQDFGEARTRNQSVGSM